MMKKIRALENFIKDEKVINDSWFDRSHDIMKN